ncbi:chaperone protein dnaJ-related [Striga asiatica]|uniref:Chaperone protein dnaJ-related n=1 Tax=Striga asiatica TaxID=4170 RepID=A0A5A7PDN5_STRAF|nr:chaperone protein dnaJ-related [Striga asiatica]
MFEHITASEIAGYGVGALLLSATLSAPKIDSFISSSQRSSLGMCKRCGDLKLVACFKCKGYGLIKEGGPFNFVPIVGESMGFGGKSKSSSNSSCSNCRGRGHFPCPQCSTSKSSKT